MRHVDLFRPDPGPPISPIDSVDHINSAAWLQPMPPILKSGQRIKQTVDDLRETTASKLASGNKARSEFVIASADIIWTFASSGFTAHQRSHAGDGSRAVSFKPPTRVSILLTVPEPAPTSSTD